MSSDECKRDALVARLLVCVASRKSVKLASLFYAVSKNCRVGNDAFGELWNERRGPLSEGIRGEKGRVKSQFRGLL